MEFEKVIAERYSLRRYSGEPVEEDKLKAILNAANIAPTAKNIQPQRLLVLRSEQARARADKCMGCHFSAPLMVIVAYDEAEQFIREDGQEFGAIDAAIVATHMLLEAENLGIGSCYVGLFDKAALQKEFAELSGCTPIGVLCFGYPQPEAHPSKLHAARKPLEETVKFL